MKRGSPQSRCPGGGSFKRAVICAAARSGVIGGRRAGAGFVKGPVADRVVCQDRCRVVQYAILHHAVDGDIRRTGDGEPGADVGGAVDVLKQQSLFLMDEIISALCSLMYEMTNFVKHNTATLEQSLLTVIP